MIMEKVDTKVPYPPEVLGEDEDDGTMPANVDQLAGHVVGRRIVKAEQERLRAHSYSSMKVSTLVLTLDDGTRVALFDQSDCCAGTELDAFLLNPELVDHVITGIGTTDEYATWHVYADMGDVLELKVGWSCGNFYYAYGFDIRVVPAPAPDDDEE